MAATAALVAGCSTFDQTRSATRQTADYIQVQVANSPKVEHYEDMTTANIVAAAEHVGANVVSATSEHHANSIYEWTVLVVAIPGSIQIIGGDQDVVGCWRLEFEGKFTHGSPKFVDCPDTVEAG